MAQESTGFKLFIPNADRQLSTPLAVPGAEPGDSLEIRLTRLSPEASALGYAAVFSADHVKPLPAGNHGGCLLPAPLYPGNSLYLPVFFPEGGLSLGEPVPAQPKPVSNCETGSSSQVEVEIQVNVLEDFPLQRPRLENRFSWSFLSCHSRPAQALNLAWQDVLAHLQSTCFCSREKARALAAAGTQVSFYCAPGLPATTACICLPKSIVRLPK